MLVSHMLVGYWYTLRHNKTKSRKPTDLQFIMFVISGGALSGLSSL